MTDKVEDLLSDLTKCPVDEKEISEIIKSIQKIVDEFSFQECSNLFEYVKVLDTRIQDILKKKLEEHIIKWRDEFVEFQEKDDRELITVKTVLEVKL